MELILFMKRVPLSAVSNSPTLPPEAVPVKVPFYSCGVKP